MDGFDFKIQEAFRPSIFSSASVFFTIEEMANEPIDLIMIKSMFSTNSAPFLFAGPSFSLAQLHAGRGPKLAGRFALSVASLMIPWFFRLRFFHLYAHQDRPV